MMEIAQKIYQIKKKSKWFYFDSMKIKMMISSEHRDHFVILFKFISDSEFDKSRWSK